MRTARCICGCSIGGASTENLIDPLKDMQMHLVLQTGYYFLLISV